MPVVLRIIGWRAEGLRCPDHEINCIDANGKPFPVSLIQMPNGTGKTTALTLLRAALSGAADNSGWDRKKVLEFRKRTGGGDSGYFELHLLLNGRRATIIMEFDFDSGHVGYKTTYGDGQRPGFHPPPDFRRFMNQNFVNFFVFDGELAQHLLDREYTDAQLVVENLFQMSAFDDMARNVGEYWEKKTQSVGATEEKGRSRRQKRLENLRERLTQLTRVQNRLLESRSDLVAQLAKKREAYQEEIKREETRSQALTKAKTELERLNAMVRKEALDVLDCMRDPHALSSSIARMLLTLKNGLDKAKLPESAAQEFFEDLADESECVCGRPIDPTIAKTIRTRAGQYLGSDDITLLNSIKFAIKESVGEKPDTSELDLSRRMASLSITVGQERDAKNDLDSLSLEVEQSDPVVKSARDRIENLKTQIDDVDSQLQKFESEDNSLKDERTFGIKVLKKRLENAEKRLAEITHTLDEKAKRDKLTQIINCAHEKAQNGISAELCKEGNERIRKLMPDNNIMLDSIERNLKLKGQEGGSVGETLSVAYAFLATLFHRSEHQLPFVVDSPAGPIDLAVRPQVGHLIPSLTGQFIAFTISSEREQFITPLKRAARADIQFVTVFRKGAADLKKIAYRTGKVIETGDGLNVTGESFFNDFQLEREDLSDAAIST